MVKLEEIFLCLDCPFYDPDFGCLRLDDQPCRWEESRNTKAAAAPAPDLTGCNT